MAKLGLLVGSLSQQRVSKSLNPFGQLRSNLGRMPPFTTVLRNSSLFRPLKGTL
eukprot:CAMPEP_0201108556 /NCGR_PEP_ID=MMETSP0812-20130820/62177_1 /ASSEMBLY_ACC=CAM_ASM_000668 /TAXON_ID=98059 /ORGANISM="Dinobryon sp., Strain UTEXLB2267" /LENGTH=53 /DNA_ID=CAMNT_0047370065 /DNA_START=46 /DNA_END=204 /DNA_ORIENTATION=+